MFIINEYIFYHSKEEDLVAEDEPQSVEELVAEEESGSNEEWAQSAPSPLRKKA